MNILITGGTGFIGEALCQRWVEQGHQVGVVSRDPKRARKRLPADIDVRASIAAFEDFVPQVVVNLAGEPIASRRWSVSRKAKLVSSRTDTTRALVAYVAQLPTPPKVFISASAVGYYGDCGSGLVTEETAGGHGFSHQLCAAWEAEASAAIDSVDRLCILRIGLVLDQPGGLLDRMVPPFKLGLGGRFGSGDQYMPWIHREDMVRAIEFLVAHDECSGIFNASAPHPVTNREFSDMLAQALHRPQLLPVPAALLKAVFGEMSELMLTGANMHPKRLLDAGFEFHYRALSQALVAILSR